MKQIAIELPKIGESTTEARIVEWLKKPGDNIVKDEAIAVIGTDKVDSEIFSEYNGVLLELLVEEGKEAKVGQAIAKMEINESDEKTAEKQEDSTPLKAQTEIAPQKTLQRGSGRQFLSPLVRKLAAENNLNLAELQNLSGSGVNGRIRKEDLQKFLQSKNPIPKAERRKLELHTEPGEQLVPLSRMRRLIAENMENSWRSIPHVTTFIDVNLTPLVQYRNSIKDIFAAQNGAKLTYTHLIMKAVVKTIQDFPQLNSWFDNENILHKTQVNLGFATALPDGNLIVPNIKNAAELSLEDLAINVAEVASRARNGKLAPGDISGTTFTVSNTGMFGSEGGTPIISQPQVGVLALGNIVRRPWVIMEDSGETLQICDVMKLSLSYDHRVIDGALASKFLTQLKKELENY